MLEKDDTLFRHQKLFCNQNTALDNLIKSLTLLVT